MGSTERLTVAYLTTTFPVVSETFVRREVRALREHDLDLQVYSLWGGRNDVDGFEVVLFPKWRALSLLWRLPLLVCRHSGTVRRVFRALRSRRVPSWENAGETLIGLAFAAVHAERFRRFPPHLIHAAWATMPATAAFVLSELNGIPFSMDVHAYDLYQDGGDWMLPVKLDRARFVRTSTHAALRGLRERGCPDAKAVLIRQGLDAFPAIKPLRADRRPLRILSVGRTIPKKGYGFQLAVYRALTDAGFPFEAHIIGGGSCLKALRREVRQTGLRAVVDLPGRLPFERVTEQFAWADVFVFTGRVAPDGDRDGLPNVIAEAMAWGLPVVSTAVSGVPEAVDDGETGVLLGDDDPAAWVPALTRLAVDDAYCEKLRAAARAWVEREFDAHRNMNVLYLRFQEAAKEAAGVRAGSRTCEPPAE